MANTFDIDAAPCGHALALAPVAYNGLAHTELVGQRAHAATFGNCDVQCVHGRSITLRVSNVNTQRARHISRTVNNGRMETFAQRLRRLRIAAKLTQEELALRCGYKGQSRIAGYESSGKFTRNPPVSEISTLAKGLGVSDTELVDTLPPPGHADQGATPEEMTQVQMLLGLTAKALAAAIPAAGRELIEEVERQLAPLRVGTFPRDFADAVRAELPVRAGRRTASAARTRKRL